MNADAGIHDDLIVTKIEGGVIIILNAACKNTDFEILQKTLGGKYKMVLDDEKSLIAIQGPQSSKILEEFDLNEFPLLWEKTPASAWRARH